MASWLKVAEDLFEVVDRRAKLVVSELADEQSDSQPSANGQEVQTRRTKTKDKGQLRHPGGEPLKPSNSEKEQNRAQISMPTVGSDIDEAPSSEKLVDIRDSSTEVTSADPLSETTKDTVISSIASSEVLHDGSREHDANNEMEATTTENTTEDVTSPGNGVASIEGSKVGLEEISSTPSIDQTDFVREDQPTNATPKDKLTIDNDSLKIDQDRHDTERVETDSTNNGKENDSGLLLEVSPELKKQQGLKTEMSPMRVQDQLDEAQGLLRSANSTGQSKEARLARVCAGLSSRLQEYKSENAQLEELLVAERELSHTYEARVKQLQQDLSVSKIEVARVESSMADALAAKNAELEALLSSMDALKKQASASEGKLASLQADMDAIMRSRELTETRVMQALREELASAERRAEEERMAHNATKMAAVEREVELEHRAVEASNALARNQRTADESTSRAMELGHKVALLEVECASLTQELQEMEARAKRGKKKSSEDANQILQMQAWQEEVERAHQGQRDAESKLSVLEAEVQKMRVEMSGMRRDAEHYSRQEHMELEKRYRELTDLLYHKQTQLEAMASEKSAAEFQLEKEARRLQEAQVEAERSRVSRRASSSWEEDTDLRALEYAGSFNYI